MNKNKILVAVSIVIVAITAYMAGGSIDLKVTYPAPGSELVVSPPSAVPSLNKDVLEQKVDKLLDASQELQVEVEKDLGVK